MRGRAQRDRNDCQKEKQIMRSILFLFAAAVLLNACGIKRPLIKPADIPAYEEEQRKKLEERENYRRDNNL